MAMLFEKRYLPDYKYEETYDPIKKKIITTATYIGPEFVYLDAPKARNTAAWLFGGTLLSWLVFLGAMAVLNAASTWAWVILPYICLLVPLWYITNRLFTAMRVEEPMNHRDSDRVTLFQYGTIPGMILTGIALAGEVVTLLILPEKMLWGDWVFIGCAVALLVYFGILHLKKKDMETRPIVNE